MADFPDHATLANLPFIEEEYTRYLADPKSVEATWRAFFGGIDFASFLHKRSEAPEVGSVARILGLIQNYRRYGHLLASVNPLEVVKKRVKELELETLGFAENELEESFPTLGTREEKMAPLREIIESLKEIYASRIGFEYMDLGNSELERWMQERIEPKLFIDLSLEEKRLALEYLNKSELFETFLHARYVGQTRFSIEGTETAIPMIAEIIDRGSSLGVEEVWIGMSHRGRLNVLANILNKPHASILEEFEDDTALSFSGSDDVKYHMGFTGEFVTREQKKLAVGFPANPSHLESVDPVILGQVRARQTVKGDGERRKVAPILIHGDAALAGQGVVYESMQFMRLSDYSVGGAIHLVLNNQIGYTTLPSEGRSTSYATDIAKAFGVPVLHVNAEDPESCIFAAKLAVDIRQKFQCDVFLDLLGYRKYGHNEGDEPSYTQPVQYKMIRAKKSIRQIYLETLLKEGSLEQKIAEMLEAEFKETLKGALAEAQSKEKKESVRPVVPKVEAIATEKDAESLKRVLKSFCKIPEGFHLHPKLEKWLLDRSKMLEGSVDWATAEALGFGSLLLDGISIRLAGEDSQRGTFSQRHMVWTDAETGVSYSPLSSLQKEGVRFDCVNSPLTEYAGLGFEYGYSCGAPETLDLWEAQYGDFDNGAQIIIDQYIASAEQKWNVGSSIVLLLPHAYEGAGPEHSSARLERFLQLSANDNMQVVNATTPAQYFHLLRRQALSKVKKPLVVMTPKSLLRARDCVSSPEEFYRGTFQEVLDDQNPPKEVKRVILCSGKLFYDLAAERAKRKESHTLIVRIEQLYPLDREKLQKAMGDYKEYIWVQEEPENMGAWSFLRVPLLSMIPKGAVLKWVSRPANSTPATGSHTRHKFEQKALVEKAFDGD